ncbi:MAG TPA: hypothetical protein VJV79_34140 [Polyangiaceae bacterium]|nr:hypothetical protein [Polyangiaceae bacterium]
MCALACGGNKPAIESGGAAGQGVSASGAGQVAGANGEGASGAGQVAGASTTAASGASGASSATGASGAGQVPTSVLKILPGATSVIQGSTAQFTASVQGAEMGTVTWSVVEQGKCGSVDSTGLYTAPPTQPQPSACHLQATTEKPKLSAVVTVTVALPPATGKLDTWENVTPPGITLDQNFHGSQQNFGAMGVVADPVRPNELYAFFCYQGVWKSVDYGLTWNKVSTGMNGAKLDDGRPWTAKIDDDPARDAATPPTLYTTSGYGSALGVYKSTDGGVNWTIYAPGLDVYSFDIDPYDHQHLLTGMHEFHNLAESTDGGKNWKTIPTDPSNGKSIYPYFMDTGDPVTTRKTWLLIPQIDSGNSTYTSDGGATFKPTGGGVFAHPHGGNQFFRDSTKIGYAAGSGGVWETLDAGLNWRKTYSASNYGYANGVVGTKNSLYSWDTGSNLGGIGGSHIHKAARKPGSEWKPVVTPASMSNGPQGMAVTYDGAHYILVGGAVNAGVWRYVEP